MSSFLSLDTLPPLFLASKSFLRSSLLHDLVEQRDFLTFSGEAFFFFLLSSFRLLLPRATSASTLHKNELSHLDLLLSVSFLQSPHWYLLKRQLEREGKARRRRTKEEGEPNHCRVPEEAEASITALCASLLSRLLRNDGRAAALGGNFERRERGEEEEEERGLQRKEEESEEERESGGFPDQMERTRAAEVLCILSCMWRLRGRFCFFSLLLPFCKLKTLFFSRPNGHGLVLLQAAVCN